MPVCRGHVTCPHGHGFNVSTISHKLDIWFSKLPWSLCAVTGLGRLPRHHACPATSFHTVSLVSLLWQTLNTINLRKARLALVDCLIAQSASVGGKTQLQTAPPHARSNERQTWMLSLPSAFYSNRVPLSWWALLLQLNLPGNGVTHTKIYFRDDYKSSHAANEDGPSHLRSLLSIEMTLLPCSPHLPQSSSHSCSGNQPGAFPTYMVCLPYSPGWFIPSTSSEVLTKTWP